MTEQRAGGRVSRRRAVLAWSVRDCQCSKEQALPRVHGCRMAGQASSGTGFSSGCWRSSAWRVCSARWVLPAVRQSPSLCRRPGRRPSGSLSCHGAGVRRSLRLALRVPATPPVIDGSATSSGSGPHRACARAPLRPLARHSRSPQRQLKCALVWPRSGHRLLRLR